MIFIDTSVFIAVLALEPDRAPLIEAIESAEGRLTSPFIRLETSIVLATRLARSPREAEAQFDKFLVHSDVVEVDVPRSVGSAAVACFEAYGEGRHPARLNFADCLAYASAKVLRARLLFKGDDFAKTDVNSWI